jgi:hypothetical protein
MVPIRASETPSSRLRRLMALLAALALLASGAVAAKAAPATFYVDCGAGSDLASGLSTSHAWRTLARANNAPLVPGGRLLLKRGCIWTGPLTARWKGTTDAPITIGAYGSGDLPRIQNGHENVMITGSHLVIEEIWTRSDVPGRDRACEDQPVGWRVGFRFMPGSSNVTVQGSRADEQYIGVLIEPGARHNRVRNNTLRNNNMRDPNLSVGAGAVGIALMGDDNEVAYNTISGSDACSPLYGRDGAAIEVYGGRRNSIHHNRASENNTFTELGKSSSADNVYAYNMVTSTLPTANFLVTRGSGDGYGPVYRTRVYNNTVYLSGSESIALSCYGGCGPDILTFKNNIVWAQDRIGYADRGFDEGNNIYWRADGAPKVYFPTSPSSTETDPRFVDLAGRNLRLTGSSPGLDVSSGDAHTLGFNTDLDGVAIPQGGAPDVGAFERRLGDDRTAPTMGPPRLSIKSPATLGAEVLLRSSWAAEDIGSGIQRYRVQERIGTSAWQGAALSSPTSTTRSILLPLEKSVGVRVRAVDRASNVSAWAEMPLVKASGFSEATSLATYSGSWRTGSAASAWRGRFRYSTSAGATVSFRFGGQAVGLVATGGPNRGRARIYLDGVYLKTIDLRSATTRYRQVVFSTRVSRGTHTLKVMVLRTSPRTRVDIDGFLVLR